MKQIRDFKKNAKSRARGSRKPSVYNLFVRDQLEKMANDERPRSERFKEVSNRWKKLPDEQRKKYQAKYEAEIAKMEIAKKDEHQK